MENSSALLIRLSERFNREEALLLSGELRHSLALDRPCMIVDFSNVKQMDTAGLDMILDIMVKVARQDGAVQIGNASAEAATILELTGMDRVLNMFPRIPDDTATVQLVPGRARAEKEEAEEEEEQAQTEAPQPVAA
ncbi:MAG: STAS domain-containing protein [Terriglobales bacterium]